jgi:hypothetical protein
MGILHKYLFRRSRLLCIIEYFYLITIPNSEIFLSVIVSWARSTPPFPSEHFLSIRGGNSDLPYIVWKYISETDHIINTRIVSEINRETLSFSDRVGGNTPIWFLGSEKEKWCQIDSLLFQE